MKTLILPVAVFIFLIISCKNNTNTARKDVKQYTIEQLY
ncbi:MAG: hypothetical protein AVDCRST_MAG96-2385, partial [uncultured Segetibacter sp.]